MKRPPYREIEASQLAGEAYDVCEIKRDGMWARVEIAAGVARVYSRTDRLCATLTVNDPSLTATLVGERISGTTRARSSPDRDRVILFDALAIDGVDLRALAQRERVQRLGALIDLVRLGAAFGLVRSYPAASWREVWARHVATGEREGLVFKRSDQPWGAPWARMKATVTADFVCMGAIEGNGRMRGTCGALIAGLVDQRGELRRITTVGAGLNARERAEIWRSRAAFLGRVFEVEGKGRASGARLRHPVFVRWRADKAPQECTTRSRRSPIAAPAAAGQAGAVDQRVASQAWPRYCALVEQDPQHPNMCDHWRDHFQARALVALRVIGGSSKARRRQLVDVVPHGPGVALYFADARRPYYIDGERVAAGAARCAPGDAGKLIARQGWRAYVVDT